MAKRVDAYLSRKAQDVWPGAYVQCRTEGRVEIWSLERPRQALPPIRLGGTFKAAVRAIRAISLAEHAHQPS